MTRPFLFALGAVTVTACGPSFQAIYEGDARFEHCYALEENPNVAMKQKGECWRDWMAHYTYGQTRDRVAYASARSQAINRAPALPTDEAMMHAAPGETGPSSAVVAPAPTSAFAPPPKTLGEANDAGAPPADWAKNMPPPPEPPKDAGTSDRPPLADCTDTCQRDWTSCKTSCTDNAKRVSCEGKCIASYKTCLKGCVK